MVNAYILPGGAGWSGLPLPFKEFSKQISKKFLGFEKWILKKNYPSTGVFPGKPCMYCTGLFLYIKTYIIKKNWIWMMLVDKKKKTWTTKSTYKVNLEKSQCMEQRSCLIHVLQSNKPKKIWKKNSMKKRPVPLPGKNRTLQLCDCYKHKNMQ